MTTALEGHSTRRGSAPPSLVPSPPSVATGLPGGLAAEGQAALALATLASSPPRRPPRVRPPPGSPTRRSARLASRQVDPEPLDPLFLGDASMSSDEPAARPPSRGSTVERDLRYAAELARSPTPPPTPDEVIEAALCPSPPQDSAPLLDSPPPPSHRSPTPPVDQTYPGRVTPPPRRPARSPSPAEGERYHPTWPQIVLWAENFHPPVLLITFARQSWPPSWVLEEGSAEYNRLRHLVLRRLTEGSSPWPTHTCERCARLDVPCFPSAFADPLLLLRRAASAKCVHCVEGGYSGCRRDYGARHPAHIYTGDAAPALLRRGEQGVLRAHLTAPGSLGLGEVRSVDRTEDARNDSDWSWAFKAVFSHPQGGRILSAAWQYMTARGRLFSERQPFEGRHHPGAPAEPINSPLSPPPETPPPRPAPRRAEPDDLAPLPAAPVPRPYRRRRRNQTGDDEPGPSAPRRSTRRRTAE